MQNASSFDNAPSFNSEPLIPTQSFIEAVSKIPLPKVDVLIDCKVPKQMGLMLEAGCVKKGKDLDFWSTMLLAFHAGMFVSMGAGFFTVVHSGTDTHFGLQKFTGGLAFCTGLAMVILCGSELFTGNTMLVMAWLSNKITTFQVLRNWFLVYVGNFIGSLIIAALQVWGRTHENGSYTVGKVALNIAQTKCGREWGQCYALGILCNIMVCWSVWMALSSRTAMDKLLTWMLSITAFAAMGFEHCVANMYFLPVALMIRTYATDKVMAGMGTANNNKVVLFNVSVPNFTSGKFYWEMRNVTSYATTPGTWPDVTIAKMIYANLIPATLGNMSGAIIFVGIVYWYLYLRDDDHSSRVEFYIGNTPFLASPPTGRKKKSKKQEVPAVSSAPAAPVPSSSQNASPTTFSQEMRPIPSYQPSPANYQPPVPMAGSLDVFGSTPASSPADQSSPALMRT